MAQNIFIQHCRQEAETTVVSKRLALSIRQFFKLNPATHFNISLVGNLGAGKTTFARHFIQSLGYEGPVKSPTYTLCEPYSIEPAMSGGLQHPMSVHHFDLYRMQDPREWQEAGFVEYFDEPGLCLVEWPEKAEGTLPAFDLQIFLSSTEDENERVIELTALSPTGIVVLQALHLQTS